MGALIISLELRQRIEEILQKAAAQAWEAARQARFMGVEKKSAAAAEQIEQTLSELRSLGSAA